MTVADSTIVAEQPRPAKPLKGDPRFSTSRTIVLSYVKHKGTPSAQARMRNPRNAYPIELSDGVKCDASQLTPVALRDEMRRREIPFPGDVGKQALVLLYGEWLDEQAAKAEAG